MIFGPARTINGRGDLCRKPGPRPPDPGDLLPGAPQGRGLRRDRRVGAGRAGHRPLGYNGHIAWSAIASQLDCLDFFVEKINPDNPDQYLTENGWKDFEIVEETLKIKTDDGIKEEKMTVKISASRPHHLGRGFTRAGKLRHDVDGKLGHRGL